MQAARRSEGRDAPRAGRRPVDRAVAAFLLCLMVAGSLVLWIGVPLGCLWASAKVVDSLAGHFLVALPTAVAAMAIWGWGLFWLNGLYLRVTGFYAEPEDPDDPPQRIRGPLEPILVASLIIAVIALFVWFFGFAENPSSQVI